MCLRFRFLASTGSMSLTTHKILDNTLMSSPWYKTMIKLWGSTELVYIYPWARKRRLHFLMVEIKNLAYAMNWKKNLPRESRASVLPNSLSAPLMGSVHCLQDQKLWTTVLQSQTHLLDTALQIHRQDAFNSPIMSQDRGGCQHPAAPRNLRDPRRFWRDMR